MRYKNNQQNSYRGISSLKVRLMIFAVIVAGFIAQMAIIGPATQPVQNDRDSENIPSSAAPQIDRENDKKLKQLKVVPTLRPADNTAGSLAQSGADAPSLQASSPSAKASPQANKNSSNSSSQNSNGAQTNSPSKLCVLRFCL